MAIFLAQADGQENGEFARSQWSQPPGASSTLENWGGVIPETTNTVTFAQDKTRARPP